MQIGTLRSQQIDHLRSLLKNVEGAVERSAREPFRALSERLDDWAARIAVIGQVKAGKSTFLNAFLHHHDFLPSDINPWTSVVTNISINRESKPAMGASFEFFDESDWNEIIEGTDRIRKMTEELLPGFDTELLKKQSEEMRERAQRRLGKHYHALLGKSHDYDFHSSDLLKRYVCAGPGSDDGLERESLGRYAAITKVANVYMRLPEFAVPAILTDTPGVNDPFLVRDEFTCRSLDKSDVFVMVLSAHQALTEVDIALIRILARQDNKDVIIFINRIDELDDYCTQVPRLIEDVSARLSAAIPEIEFSILAGSGYLADLTLRPDEEAKAEAEAMDTPALAAFLQETYGEVPEDREDRLLLMSGLAEIKKTLSTVIDNGIGCHHLNTLFEDLRAEVAGVRLSAKKERLSVQEQIEGMNASGAATAIETMEAELTDIGAVRDRLEAQYARVDEALQSVVTTAWTGLEKALHAEIETFVAEQRDTFEAMVQQDQLDAKAANTVEIELTPLQAIMEEVVAARFAAVRSEIDQTLYHGLDQCRESLADRFGAEDTVDITLDNLPWDSFNSTLTLSKKTLQLSVVFEGSWAFWRKKSANIAKTVEALKQIATAEMRPSIDKILRAFNEAQGERVAGGTERIYVLVRAVEKSISEQTHRLKKDKRQLQELSQDPARMKQVVNRLQSQLEVLERRIQHLSIAESSLDRASLDEAA